MSISAILDDVPYAMDEVTLIDFEAKPDPSQFVIEEGAVAVLDLAASFSPC